SPPIRSRVRARSGLRRVAPAAGGRPPGRKMAAASGCTASSAAALAVHSAVRGLTGKPARAHSTAAARSRARGRRPRAAWASPERAGAPGGVGVADTMPFCGIASRPRARNQSMPADAAAGPAPSRKRTPPRRASWMSQNASPPMLVMCGYTTASTAPAAMAASTAEPPAARTSAPASEARACGHATIPDRAEPGARPAVRTRPPPSGRLLLVGEADRLADLGDLAGVIVPVVVEHGADEHRDRDLVGAHELLEQRDARLALEVGVADGVEIREDLAP